MRRKARPGGGRQLEVRVEGLGARGDGLAQHEGRPLYLAQALPGDLVRARLVGQQAGGFRGEVMEVLEEGPGRVLPPCPHFGPCGGCSLQHLATERYAAWKRDLLAKVLTRQGLPLESLRPLISIPPGSRRRVTLAYARTGAGLRLGFHERQSHQVVEVTGCLLVTERLRDLLAPLRGVLEELAAPGERGELALLDSESGIDLLLAGPRDLDLSAREALAAFAEAQDLARLSWRAPDGEPEPLALRRSVQVNFSGYGVTPPPGGFLQPSREGEAALVAAVASCLPPGIKKAADLYCGCGTFTFALASHGVMVKSIEGDGPALTALEQAARAHGLAGSIVTEARDLARRPLPAEELAPFDLVLFDPPRAGAKEQAQALATSAVEHVIAVSCNPATFGRDAAIMVAGGYDLGEVQPVDQFPFAGHLELVAYFSR